MTSPTTLRRATRPLTDPQRCLLIDFAHAGFPEDKWVRPMDLGGRDRTTHSRVLTQLERRGLVESRTRTRGVRGSKLYRLSLLGRAVAAAQVLGPRANANDL